MMGCKAVCVPVGHYFFVLHVLHENTLYMPFKVQEVLLDLS